MKSIKIDPAYWATVKKDYSNWHFAFAREAGQNSLDAGASTIHVDVSERPNGNIFVHWRDNGCGMNEETLEDKFLALGGSFKPNGATGGFGVAKSILAFAHEAYTIVTGRLRCIGKGSEYEISHLEGCISGTNLSVEMKDVELDALISSIRTWAAWTTTFTRIYLNGSQLETARLPAKPKATQDWCKVYVSKKDDTEFPYAIRVRINGQMMFSVWSDVRKHITIELEGPSSKYLTANRDGLNYTYGDKLTKLIAQIFADPSKITSEEKDEIILFRGTLGTLSLGHKAAALTSFPTVNTATLHGVLPFIGGAHHSHSENDKLNVPFDETIRNIEKLRAGHDLVVLNNLNRPVPAKYLSDTMSMGAAKLLTRWIEILKWAAPLCNIQGDIIPGWVFSTTARALYRQDANSTMVLLNPIKVDGNRLRTYWGDTAASFYELVSTAVHELTHFHWDYHGEGFAASLTSNMGRVLSRVAELELMRKSL